MVISHTPKNTISSFATLFQPDLCDLNYTTIRVVDVLCFRRGDFANNVMVKSKSQKKTFLRHDLLHVS